MTRPLLAAVLFLIPAPAIAQPHERGFLEPASFEEVLPEPPAEGSPEYAGERAEWVASAAGADGPAWRLAAADDAAIGGREPALLFACAIGARLDERTAPRLNALMRRTLIDVEAAAGLLKRRYARPRPYEGDEAARLCVNVPADRRRGTISSYPSSSAAAGVVWADVMRAAVGGRSETQVIARGRQIGEGRLACRVHYRTDVEMGQLLGEAISHVLRRDAGFQAEARRVRAEVARALPTAAAPSGCPATAG